MKILIEVGTDVDFVDNDVDFVDIDEDSDEHTALFFATKNNKVDAVKFLLERGANPNHRDFEQCTALMKAVDYGNFEITEALLGAGADPSAQDEYSNSVLYYHFHGDGSGNSFPESFKDSDPRIAELLLKAGADLNKEFGDTSIEFDHDSRTHFSRTSNPLMYIAENNNKVLTSRSEHARLLIKYGADVDKKIIMEKLL